MKRIFTLAISFLVLGAAIAQTTSTFESNNLTPNTYWVGANANDQFTDGDATFPSEWNDAWFYWAGGWAYSNMRDSATAGWTNVYSAMPAFGVNGSENFAIGKPGAKVHLTGTTASNPLQGAYFSNTTYAYQAMKHGDSFAKKFGGDDGTDEDWLLITIWGYAAGTLTTDSVNFYLADYRDANSANDYIVDDWRYVDLSILGTCDSLVFDLTGSDTGDWGLNTPAFFAMDNFNDANTMVVHPTAIDPECGLSNGTIALSTTGGGTSYTYLWSNGSSVNGMSSLTPGVYGYTVTDNNGLSRNENITLTDLQLVVTANTTDITCAGLTDGSLALTASVVSGPFTYEWSTGASTATLTGLAAGNNNYTITSTHGCVSTGSTTISTPAAITVSASSTDVGCNGDSTGTGTITAAGGWDSFSYSWDNFHSLPTHTALAAGTYTVQVLDNGNCEVLVTMTVAEPTAISITGVITDESNGGNADGGIVVTATGGTTAYTYLWNDGSTTADITNGTAGTYTLTLTDANGCEATESFTVMAVGVIELADELNVNVYPNPAIDYIQLTNGIVADEITVTNTAGQLIKVANNTNQLDVSELTTGSYIIKVTAGDHGKQIVIQKK